MAKMAAMICLGLCCLWSACAPPPDAPPDYASLFSQDRVGVWELQLESEAWLSLLTQPQVYVPADLWIDGEAFEQIGLRIMGDALEAKPSLRIRFDAFRPGLTHCGVKRINLRSTASDPSQVREVAAAEILRKVGLPAPRAALAQVWLDGVGPGLYTLVEQVDRKFLVDRFGEKDGSLVKLEPGGALQDQGDSLNVLAYEFKGDETPPDPEGLLQFIQVLGRTPGERLEEVLPQWVDLEGSLRLWAVLAWMSELDSYLGTGDNLYLYRRASGRYVPIPWDLNRAFANYHGASCGLSTDALLDLDPMEPTCGARPLEVEAWRQRYRDELESLMDGPLAPESVEPILDRWHGLAAEAAAQDALSEFSPEEFSRALEEDIPAGDNPRRVPGLKTVVRWRDAWIRARLAGGG